MSNFSENADLAMNELREVFALMDGFYIRQLLEAVKSYQRIFAIGAGREGRSTKAFAMRLTHLGKESHWIWDDTTPALGKGDLLIAACGPGHIDAIDQVIRCAKEQGAPALIGPDGEIVRPQRTPADMANYFLQSHSYSVTTGLIKSRGLSFISINPRSIFSSPLNRWVNKIPVSSFLYLSKLIRFCIT